MSMLLSLTRENASPVTKAFFPTTERAFLTSLSATCEMRIARPARRLISLALRWRTSQVPPPTVPMPSRPTLIGFISLQPELEMLLHARPLVAQHAVHHRVADAAVAPRPVVADDAVLLRAQRLDRLLRAEIEVVGAQADHLAADGLKTVAEQQQLAGGIDVRALAALRVPGVA